MVADVLDSIDHRQRSTVTHEERLALADRAGRLTGRLEALTCALVDEAERADSAMVARGTPSTSWLSLTGHLTKKEAAALLFRAQAVAAHPEVRRAALGGDLGVSQARAISEVLGELPANLTETQRQEAERLLVTRGATVAARCSSPAACPLWTPSRSSR